MGYKKIAAAFATLLTVTGMAVGQRQQEDSVMEAKLRNAYYTAYDKGDSSLFYERVKEYMDFCSDRKLWREYFNAYQNNIIFELNRIDIYNAYKHFLSMQKEIQLIKYPGDYIVSNMLGLIYSECGNKQLAQKFLEDALKEETGNRKPRIFLYLDLAYAMADSDPQKAWEYVEMARKFDDEHKIFIEDTYTIRAIVLYKLKKYDEFEKAYQYVKEHFKHSDQIQHDQLDIYHMALHHKYAKALKMAKELSAPINSCKLQMEIYESMGDIPNAYIQAQQLVGLCDSVNGLVMSKSLYGIRNEVRMYEAEASEAASREKLMYIAIAGVLTLLGIILTVLYSRSRFIRQLKEANAQLILARDQAAESEHLKKAFVQNISHEIRTPLNIITGFMQVLDATDFQMSEEDRKQTVASMLHNTNLITSLVNEILDLSLNESVKSVPINEEIPVDDLLTVISAEHADTYPQVKINIENRLPEGFVLKTHVKTIKKILKALMDNAMKFTTDNVVRLQCDIDGKEDKVVFVFENAAQTISAADRQRIFERFVKLDNFKEGLGLGLAVARENAQKLGGDVMLDSTFKNGCRFVFRHPM
jgi:signal transduction histidine kinase